MDKQKALERYKQAEETLFTKNLKTFRGHDGRLLRISANYSGVWLEHAYDALIFATLYPETKDVALSQASVFLDNQLEDGKLPAYFFDRDDTEMKREQLFGYRQIQECVSFAKICFETYQLTGDRGFLEKAYAGLCKWDAWLCDARMTRKTGLIELFCEWDTGHDNALRLEGIPHACADAYGRVWGEADCLPMIVPDMNAVFYGDRIGLALMAAELGKDKEAVEWTKKAEQVRKKMFELLYDKEDAFFYDLDKDNQLRKFKTIQMANVFQEHVLNQEEFDFVYTRYFKSDKHFNTPIPFPAASVSDPVWVQNASGNSWNFYAQTLVALRCARWMEHYGKTEDYEKLLYKWVCAFTESELPFGQEFHPITGKPSDCSPDYSSALLFYIRAMRRLGEV